MKCTPPHPDRLMENEERFTALFYTTKDRLYQFLLSYTDNKHLIEDIMQTCYIRVWEKMDEWNDTDKLLPLIKTIARNLLLNALREKAQLPVEWLETYSPETAGECRQEDPQVLKRSLERLDSSINQLPEQCRKVFLLHREKGLSYYEIAQRLAISPRTVKNHMSKAIRYLKSNLELELLPLLFLLAGIDSESIYFVSIM